MPISIEDVPASHVFFIECYLQIFREPRGTNTWVMAPVNRGLIPLLMAKKRMVAWWLISLSRLKSYIP